jgi:lipopolysaccharide/colanic/teichoic acid biosynthesis glycosyltransferase
MLFVRAAVLGYAYLAGTVHFAGATLGTRQPAIAGWKRLIKRGMDVAGALVGLLLALPVVAVAAIAIKLDSPGPVFCYQVRIGENGRPFRLIKLRSVAADDARYPESTPVNPPLSAPDAGGRVTRVGRLLQRTSLDDTPQFFNVLIGDMSLVGPRPDEARVVALYEDFHRRRLAVKPGLTGPMQVDGRSNLSLAERIRVELDYIDHYSLMRDFEIIVRTFPAIWRGHAAESSYF